MSHSSQETCAAIYKQLFTDLEWQIIDEALSEYQDHLGEDAEQGQKLLLSSSKDLCNLPSHGEQLMQEFKFLLYGEWIRPNGHQMYDILGYIKPTREDAIAM